MPVRATEVLAVLPSRLRSAVCDRQGLLMLPVLCALLLMAAIPSAQQPPMPWDRGPSEGTSRGDVDQGWSTLTPAAGCIGGDRCRHNGERIELPLQPQPVVAIRFDAHDNVGDRSGGRLQVRIDYQIIAGSIDISRRGEVHELPVDRLQGHMLVLEATTNDEVVVGEVAVLYASIWGSQAGGWQPFHDFRGCIGGSRCPTPGSHLELQLTGAPVTGIRFFAHDNVGSRGTGHLQLRIDNHVVAGDIDIRKSGRVHELEVPSIPGYRLVFEEIAGDEVIIEDVEVRYATSSHHQPWQPSQPQPWQQPGEEWRAYPHAGRCIGGSRCPTPGDQLEVQLEGAPVTGIRFHAHDRVGDKRGAHVQIRIDQRIIVGDLDIKKGGQVHELEVPGVQGYRLIIEEIAGDEAVIEDLEVRYAVGGHSQPWQAPVNRWQEYPQANRCIGGKLCEHNGTAIVIDLEPAPVYGVRFFARDNLGHRFSGRLRVEIGGQVLEHSLDIPDRGYHFELAAQGLRGRRLILECVTDDEVMVEQIEVQYGPAGWR